MVVFHHGVKPNDPNRPRLYFSAFRQAGAVAPASVNYSVIPAIGMLGNDKYGDCVEAGNAHIIEQQTYIGQNLEYAVSEADTLAAYTRITGFNPNDPSTDQGTELQAGLDDLRKVGFGGHKIAAFAQLDPRNMGDVKLAVSEFGAVSIGMAFPASAMDQFNNGQPWDVVAGSPIEGGHCVIVAGYDANYLYVFTWGTIQRMTYAFWNTYVAANGGEAWAVIDQEWVNTASGRDVEGVDLATFGAQFAALTGQPNPFPAPQPTPTPVPVPTPTPTPPALDAAELALVAAADRYLKLARHRQLTYLTVALKNWLADKGQA